MVNRFFFQIIIFIAAFFFFSENAFCQKDTTVIENVYISVDSTGKFVDLDEIPYTEIDSSKIKSPKKAAILSACFPGLGQIYNHKYWKLPIVWGLVGTASYGVYYTFDNYLMYLNDYVTVISGSSEPTISGLTSESRLLENKNKFRKYRDLSVMAWLVIYGLNIVDANIDAHFSNFDVSEDLSLNISPNIINLNDKNYIFGINLALAF